MMESVDCWPLASISFQAIGGAPSAVSVFSKALTCQLGNLLHESTCNDLLVIILDVYNGVSLWTIFEEIQLGHLDVSHCSVILLLQFAVY